MKNLNRNEAELLEKVLEDNEYNELYEARLKKRVKSKMPRKKMPVQFVAGLVVAVLLMSTGVTCVADENMRMKLADVIGVEELMDELEPGCVRIDKSVTSGEHTVTAQYAIGDEYNQWVYFETDYEYDEELINAGNRHMFEDFDVSVTNGNGVDLSCSATFEPCYINDKVGFLLHIDSKDKLNKAKIYVKLKDLAISIYENGDFIDFKLVDEKCYEFEWKNYYMVSSRTIYPMKITEDNFFVYKIDVTPISIVVKGISLNGRKNGEGRQQYINIQSATLQDGNVLTFDGSHSAGLKNSILADSLVHLNWEPGETANGTQITSVTIGGETFEID